MMMVQRQEEDIWIPIAVRTTACTQNYHIYCSPPPSEAEKMHAEGRKEGSEEGKFATKFRRQTGSWGAINNEQALGPPSL
jgi:hypothetical protein